MAQTPIPSGGFPRGQHPLQSPAVQALPLQQRAFLQTEFFKEQNRLVQNGAQQQQVTKADQLKRSARVEQEQAIAVGQKYKARKALDAEIDRLNLNLAYTSTGAQPMGQEDRITLLTQIQNLENNRWRFEANNDWEKALYQKMDALDRGVDAAGYGVAGGLVAKALRPITAGSLRAAGLNPSIGMSANPGLNARLAPALPSASGNLRTLPGSNPGTTRASPSNPFSKKELARAARDLLDPDQFERDEDLEAEFGPEKAQDGDTESEPSYELVRVGRWMRQDELEKMQKTGRTVRNYTEATHVTFPPREDGYRAYPKNSFFVTFEIGTQFITGTSDRNTHRIIDPYTVESRLAKRNGKVVEETMPRIFNIRIERTAE